MPASAAVSSSLLSRRDLQFLLHEWLQVERLRERLRFAEHSREIVGDVLDLAEQIAAERFAPHNRRRTPPSPTSATTAGWCLCRTSIRPSPCSSRPA